MDPFPVAKFPIGPATSSFDVFLGVPVYHKRWKLSDPFHAGFWAGKDPVYFKVWYYNHSSRGGFEFPNFRKSSKVKVESTRDLGKQLVAS